MRLSTSLRLNAQKGLVTPYDPALTLDLQFAARQAYVANIGPLPTFTNLTSTARTFVGSDGLIQTAATNVPRIDFDPVTRLCRGLLIEEQRQNLTIWSEDTTQGTWSKAAVTATANTTTAPDGSGSADTISETTANSQHFFYSPAASITSGTAYSNSIFLKKGSGATAPDWVVIAFLSAGFGSRAIAFNVSTGVFGVAGGGLTGTSQAYPNGWWRINVVSTATASGTHGSIYIGFTNNANTISTPTYPGQTTSNLFVWGAQVEVGAFASSYIPTTTGSLIRSADVCSITGAAFTGFYNQTEGTLVAKAVFAYFITAFGQTYVSASDGSTSNRTLLRNRSGSEQFINANAGVIDVNASSSGVAANVPMGIAGRYKLNDFAFSVSGGAATTDVSGVPPASVNQLAIGNELGGSQLNGWIQSIQYYNTIKTNAQLQALSTP